jgi:hypothetical protein
VLHRWWGVEFYAANKLSFNLITNHIYAIITNFCSYAITGAGVKQANMAALKKTGLPKYFIYLLIGLFQALKLSSRYK